MSCRVPPAVTLQPNKRDALSPRPEKWTVDLSVFTIVVVDIVVASVLQGRKHA